jgi:parallel beta-helix repeat protein
MNHISHLLLAVLLLCNTQLSALTYYVSNSGNNSNSGLSPAAAFLTIQKGADVAVAGDSVLVADGVYAGFDFRNKSGTESNPVVFKATGANVLINQSGPIRNDGVNIENADYVVVDGFTVNGMTGNGNGIRVVTSDFCVVRNCSCNNNAERGIFTGFTDDILIEKNVCTNSVNEHGIYVSNSSDRPVIRFNTCHGNNFTGIHINGDLSAGGDGIISDAKVYGNILYENGQAAGINMDGVENPLIFNNLIFNNHSAQGIALFQQDGAIPSRGARIYNNTIIVPSDGRWGVLVRDGSNLGTEIYNNIILNFHPWRGCITVENTSQFASDFNILHDKMSATGDGSAILLAQWQALGFDSHSQLAGSLNEIFQDPANSDYHLAANSQAINSGTTLVSGYVPNDLDGIPRPTGNAFDIGCYEFDPVQAQSEGASSLIKLFPNPVHDYLTIEGELSNFKLLLIDIKGRVVLTQTSVITPVTFRLDGLDPGFYFLLIQNANNQMLCLKKIIFE